MRRIALTTVFLAVAVPSASAGSALAGTSNTRDERMLATRYQIVVHARMVGRFRDASGPGAPAWG